MVKNPTYKYTYICNYVLFRSHQTSTCSSWSRHTAPSSLWFQLFQCQIIIYFIIYYIIYTDSFLSGLRYQRQMHLWTLALLSRLLLGSGGTIHCLGGFPYISNQVVLHRFLRWYSNPFLAGVMFQILGLSVTTCICTFNVSAFLQICIIRKSKVELIFRVSIPQIPKRQVKGLFPCSMNTEQETQLRITNYLHIEDSSPTGMSRGSTACQSRNSFQGLFLLHSFNPSLLLLLTTPWYQQDQ